MTVETDDKALLGLFQNKTTRDDGFKLILNKYSRHIYYFLRKIGLNHDDADELLQDIFVKFWRDLFQLRESDSMPVLLYWLTTDTCMKRLSEMPEGKVDVFPEQSREFTGKPEQQATEQAFSKLTTDQKIIFILKQHEQFSNPAIASITRMSIAEVRKDFNEALERFSSCYQRS